MTTPNDVARDEQIDKISKRLDVGLYNPKELKILQKNAEAKGFVELKEKIQYAIDHPKSNCKYPEDFERVLQAAKARGYAKLGVVGCQTITDYEAFKVVMSRVMQLSEWCFQTIVTGGSKGVDTMAERIAKESGLAVIVHKPDWKAYGKGAGIKRNEYIVADSDLVIAFWDGESKGTKNSIERAKMAHKSLLVMYGLA